MHSMNKRVIFITAAIVALTASAQTPQERVLFKSDFELASADSLPEQTTLPNQRPALRSTEHVDSAVPFGPNRQRKGNRMAFVFKLQLPDGQPIERFTSAVPNWRAGDPVVITPELVYLVVDVLPGDEEVQGVLVVEPRLGAEGANRTTS